MLRALIGCGVALAMLGPDPAPAQSDEATSARLEALFGDHEAYRKFLIALQAAVAAGGRAAVAAMVAYPLRTTIAGEPVTIGSAAGFLRHYDRLLTPAVVAAIERQTYDRRRRDLVQRDLPRHRLHRGARQGDRHQRWRARRLGLIKRALRISPLRAPEGSEAIQECERFGSPQPLPRDDGKHAGRTYDPSSSRATCSAITGQ
jgi:hypothetical protein